MQSYQNKNLNEIFILNGSLCGIVKQTKSLLKIVQKINRQEKKRATLELMLM